MNLTEHHSGLRILCAAALSLCCTRGVFAAAAAPAPQDPVKTAGELTELRQRLEELEEQQVRILERIGSRPLAQSYSGRSLDLGGHVSSLFTHMDGVDGNTTGHVVSIFELYVKAQIDDQWSLFATPGVYLFNYGLLDDPATPAAWDPRLEPGDNSSVDTYVARLLAEWRHRDELTVQAGMVGTPHGPANREYFIPARQIAQANLHTRYFLGNQLYPQQLLGGKLSGKLGFGDEQLRWEYDLYFGTEAEQPDDGIGGARLAMHFAGQGLTLAGNYGRGTRAATASPDTNFGALQAPFPGSRFATRDYEFFGIDVEWRQGDFLHRTEAYHSREQGFAAQRAFSSETSWFCHAQWALSYRFDYYDPGSDWNPLLSAVLDQGQATEHVFGICFLPTDSVRLRLDTHHLRLPRSDDSLNYWNLSWSISF